MTMIGKAQTEEAKAEAIEQALTGLTLFGGGLQESEQRKRFLSEGTPSLPRPRSRLDQSDREADRPQAYRRREDASPRQMGGEVLRSRGCKAGDAGDGGVDGVPQVPSSSMEGSTCRLKEPFGCSWLHAMGMMYVACGNRSTDFDVIRVRFLLVI